MSDENYKRLVVDWRSPVAETYYNQENGPTSYVANGRTIKVDLKLRRQFDIAKDTLNAYFDTTVAIQDAMLLASLSQERTSQMKAITATIQKEQNQVIRHEDVPVLLVNGIAGSGKTSVLMQRIAYLFYQQRESLRPEDVFLITPNPVFSRYIETSFPTLGKASRNHDLQRVHGTIMPADRPRRATSPESLQRIDDAVADSSSTPTISKTSSAKEPSPLWANPPRADKFKRTPSGPHLVTLMREELHKRLSSRLKQMATTERAQNEMLSCPSKSRCASSTKPLSPKTKTRRESLRSPTSTTAMRAPSTSSSATNGFASTV
ncbi:MAG: UvrD-helicase domain-containing protein [Eggerthellaceae bacterium]